MTEAATQDAATMLTLARVRSPRHTLDVQSGSPPKKPLDVSVKSPHGMGVSLSCLRLSSGTFCSLNALDLVRINV